MNHFMPGMLLAVLLVNFVSLSSGAAITLNPVVVTPRSKQVAASDLRPASDLDPQFQSRWASLKGDATRATSPEILVLPPEKTRAIPPYAQCRRLCPPGYRLEEYCQCVYQCPVLRCSQDCETYQLDVHGCKTCHCSPWSEDSDQDCFETITKLDNTKAIRRRNATVVGNLVECLNACFEDENCVAAQYFDGNQFLNTEATCDLHYRQYQLQPARGYDYYIFNRCPTIEQTTPTTSVVPTRPPEPVCLESTRGDSCVGVANGNYQDCYKCHGFVMCSNQLLHFQVCPAGLVWDDVVKRCEWKTTTCFPRDQAPPTPTPDVQEPLGCRRSCEAHEHGQYLQSCRGCQAFAICSWGTLIDTKAMVCPGEAEWDDHHKVCVHPPSSTCRLVPVHPTRG